MSATYNVTNDRLKFSTAERLPEDQYKATKAAGFQWWPGQKCFAGIWTPEREDTILSLGLTITEDDTPDNLEGRVQRFAGYADQAAKAADNATERAQEATTARKEAQASRTATREAENAEYWTRRIAGAIGRAQYRDRPDVIARRIEKLEADQRRNQKTKDQAMHFLSLWDKGGEGISVELAKHIANYGPGGEVTLSDGSRYWSAWGALDDGKITAASARAQMMENMQGQINHSDRWLSHLAMRLEYERAYLAAVGGSPADALEGLKAGDPVLYQGRRFIAAKVNKKTVQLQDPTPGEYRRYPDGAKVDRTRLQPA